MRRRAGSNTALFPGLDRNETNLPAVQDAARATPRFPGAHALERRTCCNSKPPFQRAAASRGLARPAARAPQRKTSCGAPSAASVWECSGGSGEARISSACCATVNGAAFPGSRSSSNAAKRGYRASGCSLPESMQPRRPSAIASSAAFGRRFDLSRRALARSTFWCVRRTESGQQPT